MSILQWKYDHHISIFVHLYIIFYINTWSSRYRYVCTGGIIYMFTWIFILKKKCAVCCSALTNIIIYETTLDVIKIMCYRIKEVREPAIFVLCCWWCGYTVGWYNYMIWLACGRAVTPKGSDLNDAKNM